MAQISFDKDLEELEQRLEEDLAEAVNPIYQSYIKALEELQRKAARAGDVDTAAAITKALRNLPASVLIGKRHPKNTEEVKEFLHQTTWDVTIQDCRDMTDKNQCNTDLVDGVASRSDEAGIAGRFNARAMAGDEGRRVATALTESAAERTSSVDPPSERSLRDASALSIRSGR